ncbi:DUF4189 domain-containing protein [Neisseria sp. GT4A_CT1]|uniref:DUF4189 domain-containing protein n=1 Tax=Neisseria sp. GT4A_CT1 TaxID=665946 RepID=UPI00022BF33E|nr:DUF4189 domain-containing protein [Neisseria sp. GT4A_CT1]EGY62721.1 hypothetical protein HMPREF1028_00371 [Neisseria sp. GT4A_CT1]
MKKLFLIALGLVSFNVYANGCGGEYQAATGTCRIIDGSGRQILYNVPPPQSGNSTPPSKKIVYVSKYGAVATNEKTGISSGALNKDSIEEAKHEAIKACEQGGRNAPCKVAIWAGNACLAAATGKEGKKFRVFYTAREKPGQAEPAALKQCNKAGLKNCEITIPEGCSFP